MKTMDDRNGQSTEKTQTWFEYYTKICEDLSPIHAATLLVGAIQERHLSQEEAEGIMKWLRG